jgi:hypothetical protein
MLAIKSLSVFNIVPSFSFVTEMIFSRRKYFILVNWRRLEVFVVIMPIAYLIRNSFPPRNKCDLEKISAFFQSEILPWRNKYRVFEAGREILPAEFS